MEYFYRTIEGIFENAPLWVWPLLLALIILGLRETKTRDVYKIQIYIFSLFSFIGVKVLFQLEHQAIVFISSLIFFMIGVIFGIYFQKKRILNIRVHTVRLEGEWLTLFILMVIFWSNFIKGVLTVIAPSLLSLPLYSFIISLIIAGSSGILIGRSVSILHPKQLS